MTPQGRFGVAPEPGGGAHLCRHRLRLRHHADPVDPASALAREPRSRFVLFYGNRTGASIIFREALEDLKDRFMARLSVFHVLSREKQEIAASTAASMRRSRAAARRGPRARSTTPSSAARAA